MKKIVAIVLLCLMLCSCNENSEPEISTNKYYDKVINLDVTSKYNIPISSRIYNNSTKFIAFNEKDTDNYAFYDVEQELFLDFKFKLINEYVTLYDDLLLVSKKVSGTGLGMETHYSLWNVYGEELIPFSKNRIQFGNEEYGGKLCIYTPDNTFIYYNKELEALPHIEDNKGALLSNTEKYYIVRYKELYVIFDLAWKEIERFYNPIYFIDEYTVFETYKKDFRGNGEYTYEDFDEQKYILRYSTYNILTKEKKDNLFPNMKINGISTKYSLPYYSKHLSKDCRLMYYQEISVDKKITYSKHALLDAELNIYISTDYTNDLYVLEDNRLAYGSKVYDLSLNLIGEEDILLNENKTFENEDKNLTILDSSIIDYSNELYLARASLGLKDDPSYFFWGYSYYLMNSSLERISGYYSYIYLTNGSYAVGIKDNKTYKIYNDGTTEEIEGTVTYDINVRNPQYFIITKDLTRYIYSRSGELLIELTKNDICYTIKKSYMFVIKDNEYYLIK